LRVDADNTSELAEEMAVLVEEGEEGEEDRDMFVVQDEKVTHLFPDYIRTR